MTTPAAPIEVERHILPIVRYAETSAGAGPVAVAGTAFTFGEGTLITCWHCVGHPLGPEEVYGVAIRPGGFDAPYEFCSIDTLGPPVVLANRHILVGMPLAGRLVTLRLEPICCTSSSTVSCGAPCRAPWPRTSGPGYAAPGSPARHPPCPTPRSGCNGGSPAAAGSRSSASGSRSASATPPPPSPLRSTTPSCGSSTSTTKSSPWSPARPGRRSAATRPTGTATAPRPRKCYPSDEAKPSRIRWH